MGSEDKGREEVEKVMLRLWNHRTEWLVLTFLIREKMWRLDLIAQGEFKCFSG